jgi:hypothetical protein
MINLGEIVLYSFPAFYQEPDALYLPVGDLLDLFKIVREESAEGQVMKGYVETPGQSYEINYPAHFIRFREKTVQLGIRTH